MKLFRFLFVLLLPTMLLINSCSENTTETPIKTINQGNKYAPTKVGSWWTYNNYELDSASNKIDTTEFQDKVVLNKTEVKAGDTAYVFDYQDMEGKPNGIESDYIYTTSTQIFKYYSIIPKMKVSIPFDIPIDWYKVADHDATEWTLATQHIDSTAIPTLLGTVILKGDITIKVTNTGIVNVNYGANLDKTVKVEKFLITFSFDGTGTLFGISKPVKFPVESYNYYGEGIGLVKSVLMPLSIKINFVGKEKEVYSANGFEKILLDYQIPD